MSMICTVLVAVALVASVNAAGEDKIVLGGSCGCGTGIQTYNLATSAYCPISLYPSCDITKMKEESCKITCDGARSMIAYKNNSAVFVYTSSISCVDGVLKNDAGVNLFNVQRPTCVNKNPCDGCNVAISEAVPAGFSTKASNLISYTATDGCKRVKCAHGLIKLYNSTNTPLAYDASELYCTVTNKWTNFSMDGASGGALVNDLSTSFNCILPTACEECVAPTLATTVSQLPSNFRTGYNIANPIYFKEAKSCSLVTCPQGFTLYGFSGNATNVTGLEHTDKGSLQCDGTKNWSNGGSSYIPMNMVVACLQIPPTTQAPPTTPPTTTPACAVNADKVTLAGGAVMICINGQARVECGDTSKKIEIFTNDDTALFEGMNFVPNKGWLSFDCNGSARIWKKELIETAAVVCEGAI